jgi:diketogulonate reductase-like aldo/keto reductase
MVESCTSKGIVIQAYSPLTRAKRLTHKTLIALRTHTVDLLHSCFYVGICKKT